MNIRIRVFGWLLFSIGSFLTFLGLMSMIGIVHVRIEAFGINIDTLQERIAWIVSWLVTVITGGLFLALTTPIQQEKSV